MLSGIVARVVGGVRYERVGVCVLRSDDLACFARVAAAGGFGRAAHELGLDIGDVRRRVAELEAALGVPLFVHDVDDLRLTEAGRALAASLATTREQRAAVARAEARARKERRVVEAPPVPGAIPVVRVAATPLLDATVLPDVVVSFVASTPDVRLVVGVDLLDPEVTLGQAWRVGAPPTGPLASARLRLVGSPLWLAAHGTPRTTDDVLREPGLVWPLGHGPARWPLVRRGKVEEVAVRARLRSSDLHTVRTAALHGLGPALLPEVAVAADLAAGRLVALVDDGVAQLGELVVSHARSGLSDAASAFVAHALGKLGAG